VDLTGSPALSRLLGALEIECSNPIPPLSIDEEDPAKSQYISSTQLRDLWNGANKSLVYSIEGLNSTSKPRLGTPLPHRKCKAGRSHWQDPASGLCGRSQSPFNEVYVFPPQTISLTFKHHGLDQPFWMTLKSRAADLQLKLSKLKPLLGCDHPKILIMTKKLARVYLDKGDVSKAGNLFQSLANAIQATHGPVNLKSLDVWLDVVDCLQDEGKEMQAQNILDNLYPAILNLAHPGEEAATKALHMRSKIAMRQEDWNRAEELLRQVLRVRLTLSGLKCQGTWKCISNLGKVLAKQHQNAEAERLLLIALQLVSKIPDSNPRYTAKILNALALNYAMKGQLEESEDVCRRAIEALERPLELHSRPLINLYGRMAWIFLDRRRFEESEVLFRAVVNQYSSRKVECHRSALKFAEGLAITLEHLGRIDEAAELYEKVYFGFAECSRPASEHVMSACYGLGQFYLAHGRRGDSERLYQDHIRKI
jgi:tetratricopeptide (TPR) repeat protein